MSPKLRHLWEAYSNIFLMSGSSDWFLHAAHFWWNTPLGDVVTTAASALRRKLLPRASLPPARTLSDGQYRVRVLMLLVLSALVYGVINGFADIAMMFVSIPIYSIQHPGGVQARSFYVFMSIFTAAMIPGIVFRRILGGKDYPLRSIKGLLFWFMGVFFLNVTDGGVMALSLLIDRMPSSLVQYLLMYLAILLGLTTFSELSDTYLSILLSIVAVKLMGLMNTVTYYICLPGILLVKALGLSSVFTLQFFFDLCIVLITLGITALLERFGIMDRLRRLCEKLTIAKVFFLLPFALLPVMVLLAIL